MARGFRILVGLLLALAVFLPELPASSAAASSPPTAKGGAATAGPGTTIHLPARTAQPHALTPSERAELTAATQSMNRHGPPIPTQAGTHAISRLPSVSQIALPANGRPNAYAATDLVTYRNTSVGASIPLADEAMVNEPSVSSNGGVVFFTGNWYAGVSLDGGASFGFLDPHTDFPYAAGGFCCDQRTLYDPSRNLTAWELLYAPDPTFHDNVVRLAIARGQNGVASNT